MYVYVYIYTYTYIIRIYTIHTYIDTFMNTKGYIPYSVD
jgi:hypothetical protein